MFKQKIYLYISFSKTLTKLSLFKEKWSHFHGRLCQCFGLPQVVQVDLLLEDALNACMNGEHVLLESTARG